MLQILFVFPYFGFVTFLSHVLALFGSRGSPLVGSVVVVLGGLVHGIVLLVVRLHALRKEASHASRHGEGHQSEVTQPAFGGQCFESHMLFNDIHRRHSCPPFPVSLRNGKLLSKGKKLLLAPTTPK